MRTIQSLIDEALKPKPRERSGKWSPSSFGGCYRKQYWNRQDEPKSNPPDERGLRVFKAGQLFHDFVQGLLPDMQSEVLIECADVKGYADLVSGNEVIDIKSQHSKSFWWMKKKDCDIKKEKYSNWLQVLYYARELKKEFGRLVFISKDDLCVAEYVQPLDDYWLTEIESELFALRTFWLQGSLPEPKPRCEPRKNGTYWECDYCDWKDKCFAMQEQEDRDLAWFWGLFKEIEDEHTNDRPDVSGQ